MPSVKKKSTDSRQTKKINLPEEEESQDTLSNLETPTEEIEPPLNASIPEYEINSMVLCQHTDNNFYEAKVIKVDRDATGQALYTIHYNGWNSRYDEILSHEEATTRFLEYTEENKAYAKQIYTAAKQKKTKRKDDKKRKSGGRAQTSGTVTPSVESESTETAIEEITTPTVLDIPTIPKKKPLKIELSDVLMDILIKDAEYMNSNSKLLKVPVKKSVNDIFDDFLKSYSQKKTTTVAMSTIMKDRLTVVRKGFSEALELKLLYKIEYLQYLNILNKLRREQKLVEIAPKDYFQRFNTTENDAPDSSDISDDDTSKPDEAIAPHLCAPPPEKVEVPEKRNLRSKKDTEKKGKDSKKKQKEDVSSSRFKPDFSTQYGLVHFLRYCNFIPTMFKDDFISIMIFNYFVETINELVVFADQNWKEYFDENDYEATSPGYQRQFNAHTGVH